MRYKRFAQSGKTSNSIEEIPEVARLLTAQPVRLHKTYDERERPARLDSGLKDFWL